jgi:hypothetical protein
MTNRMDRARGYIRENPIAAAAVVLGAAAGAALAVHYELPADLSPLGRALGGAIAGGWVGLFPLGFRLYE